MSLPATTGLRPHSKSRPLPSPPAAATGRKAAPFDPVPMRNFEIAALRPDGSVYIGQHKAPAIDLFESAFSAFARGTMISTPHGPQPVEDLQPGDRVNTAYGTPAKLVWIGSSSFVPADAGRRVALTRVMADSFGQGRPSGFVTVGPAARILHTPDHMRSEVGEQRLLTPVRTLVDGVNVIKVVPPTQVRLFHICLENHAALIAGGLEMESFHPGADHINGISASLRDRFLRMFPHITTISDFGPLAYPRAAAPRAEAQPA